MVQSISFDQSNESNYGDGPATFRSARSAASTITTLAQIRSGKRTSCCRRGKFQKPILRIVLFVRVAAVEISRKPDRKLAFRHVLDVLLIARKLPIMRATGQFKRGSGMFFARVLWLD